MKGMSATTGKALEGTDHLEQSIQDILTTPIGSRVMRREYGSRLFELVDRPVNPGWLLDAYAYTADALDKWEPRFRLSDVTAGAAENGRVQLGLKGRHWPDGEEIKLEGMII